ncbi:hypothetical protein [Guggenheimella bovis]
MDQKKKRILIGIIVGCAAIIAVLARIACKLNKFKKNADFFFVFSNEELDFEGEEFEDTCVASINSKVTVDLSKAKASENPMNLCLKAKGSKMDIILPKAWNVKVQGENKSSNFDNVTTFDKDDFKKPLLFINYQMACHSHLNIFYGDQEA